MPCSIATSPATAAELRCSTALMTRSSSSIISSVITARLPSQPAPCRTSGDQAAASPTSSTASRGSRRTSPPIRVTAAATCG